MAGAPAPAAPTPATPPPAPGGVPDIPAPPTPAGTAPGTAAPFSDAQAQINAQNRATLQMLTGAQTGGTNAYAAAQAAGGVDKGTAIQQLLASAIFHGAPGAAAPASPNAAATAAGTVGGAYDQRIGTTGDLSAAFNAAMGTREQGASDYFHEASAAVPVIEAQTNQRIATAHAAAQAKAVQDALDMQLKQVGLQTAYAGLAKAQASAGSGTGPGGYSDVNKVVASLGGAQLAGQSFNAQATQIGQQIRQASQAPHVGGTANSGPDNPNNAQPSQADIDAQAYAEIDKAYLLPPGTAQDLATQAEGTTVSKADAAQTKADTAAANASKPPSDAEIRNNPGYTRALGYANALWNVTGSSQASVVGALVQYAGMSPQAATLAANDTVKDRPAKPNGGPAPLPGTQGAGY